MSPEDDFSQALQQSLSPVTPLYILQSTSSVHPAQVICELLGVHLNALAAGRSSGDLAALCTLKGDVWVLRRGLYVG